MYQNVTVIVFLCWNECRFFFLFMKFPSFLEIIFITFTLKKIYILK